MAKTRKIALLLIIVGFAEAFWAIIEAEKINEVGAFFTAVPGILLAAIAGAVFFISLANSKAKKE